MQSKEVKKWQDEEALRCYQMIAPLLDEGLDEAKRRQLREEIASDCLPLQHTTRFQREACTSMKQSTGRKHLTGFVQ